LRYPNIHFLWSTKVEKLLTSEGKVVGVAAVNLRTKEYSSFRAQNVILATGGFGSNLQLIRKYWPVELPAPERLLAGASPAALGSGMEIARDAGGALSRLDHQWNYVLGLPDPEDPERARGLASFDARSIWVNREGKRFTREFADPKINLAALLHQSGKAYWSVFDAHGVGSFSIALAGWEDQREVNKLIFQTPGTVIRANDLKQLALNAGISFRELVETVERYNQLVSQGEDADFHAFGPNTMPRPHRIEKPPFYAVQFFPITRKTMGGVTVDLKCRVLNQEGFPIVGLFAAGEVTGFGGINGKAALEGTFLGPGIFMGRIAARSATNNIQKTSSLTLRGPLPRGLPAGAFTNDTCTNCHKISKEVAGNRSGFWHFEQSHKKVLDRQYRCAQCHQTFYPVNLAHHRLDRLALTDSCGKCHGVQLPRAD
jgi:succinate dehydrogenase/fumarate reductase flavoprotein subunit